MFIFDSETLKFGFLFIAFKRTLYITQVRSYDDQKLIETSIIWKKLTFGLRWYCRVLPMDKHIPDLPFAKSIIKNMKCVIVYDEAVS